MKAVVVLESMWGNTQQVAEAIARGLGPSTGRRPDVRGRPGRCRPRCHRWADARVLDDEGVDEAGRASPGATQAEDPRGILELLDELPSTVPFQVATFDTRVKAVRDLPGSAAKSAAKDLHRGHHAEVVARESFYVEDSDGPLVEGAAPCAGVGCRSRRTRGGPLTNARCPVNVEPSCRGHVQAREAGSLL